MDSGTTFSVLLYLNIFYFGLYAAVEFTLLLFKYSLVATYDLSLLVYELFLFSLAVLLESARLLIGQKHNNVYRLAPFDERLRSIFTILVLTLPSMYAVLYFSHWQSLPTRLDVILGWIMIIMQSSQFIAAFIHVLPYFKLNWALLNT
eukprot:TRINITY_DN7930_c0_g1_i1.p1 TRINITY_DN7930_c0_g1~~TRINITY_DN7930_c0_g1_i1.p1  ORF type:complete len:148 (+),score=22.41 TRINITY_DN7930_c0_g1_i1:180-623(+)